MGEASAKDAIVIMRDVLPSKIVARWYSGIRADWMCECWNAYISTRRIYQQSTHPERDMDLGPEVETARHHALRPEICMAG